MTTDSIKLLAAYFDEPTHNDVASGEETEVVDAEYSDIPVEHNDLLNPDDSECPYIRVGTDYYREVLRPQANGTTCKCLVYWKASTIKADHTRNAPRRCGEASRQSRSSLPASADGRLAHRDCRRCRLSCGSRYGSERYRSSHTSAHHSDSTFRSQP